MEIYLFGKFHAREGAEGEAYETLREVLGPSRDEAGCVTIHAFQSIRDGRCFYIHSKWKDEEALERHARLPHTVRFLARMETLVDQAIEVTRTKQVG